MKMDECPKQPTCCAPICPLDPDWRKRTHGVGDSACSIAMEHNKVGADERFASRPVMLEIRPYVIEMVRAIDLEKIDRGECAKGRGILLRQLEQAMLTGSSWDKEAAAGERLKAARLKK